MTPLTPDQLRLAAQLKLTAAEVGRYEAKTDEEREAGARAHIAKLRKSDDPIRRMLGYLGFGLNNVFDLTTRMATNNIARTKRLDAVEARLDALEALGLPSYAGTHEAGKAYGPNQLTTKGGGLWLSLRATNETPGAGATAWRLIVKKGEAER